MTFEIDVDDVVLQGMATAIRELLAADTAKRNQLAAFRPEQVVGLKVGPNGGEPITTQQTVWLMICRSFGW